MDAFGSCASSISSRSSAQSSSWRPTSFSFWASLMVAEDVAFSKNRAALRRSVLASSMTCERYPDRTVPYKSFDKYPGPEDPRHRPQRGGPVTSSAVKFAVDFAVEEGRFELAVPPRWRAQPARRFSRYLRRRHPTAHLRRQLIEELISRANIVRAVGATKGAPQHAGDGDDRSIRASLLAELGREEWAQVWPEDIIVRWISEDEPGEKRQALRVAAEIIPGVRGVEEHVVPAPVIRAFWRRDRSFLRGSESSNRSPVIARLPAKSPGFRESGEWLFGSLKLRTVNAFGSRNSRCPFFCHR